MSPRVSILWMRLPGNGTIRVKRKLNSTEVIDALTDLFNLRRLPAYLRLDNGPEFIAEAVKDWSETVGAKTAHIEPGSAWENRYCESINGKIQDELLNGEMFYSFREAQIIIERWMNHFHTKRPHSALGYRLPEPEAIIPIDQRPRMHSLSIWITQVGLHTGRQGLVLRLTAPCCTVFARSVAFQHHARFQKCIPRGNAAIKG